MITEDREFQEKQYWDVNYGGIEKYLCMPVHSEIVSWLAVYYDTIGIKILDVGGGPGVHCKLLQDKYLSKCTNIDKSRYALSFCQHGIKSIFSDISSLRPREIREKYDFIFSIQTLEHIEARDILVVALCFFESLSPGGYCFISVASLDNTEDKTHVALMPLQWWY